ncbi:GntR family transcriptional regulator [Anaerobacillus alkaliphilus]|uniref:GntR family transcriptional regulator n=1 Tax=Anaerobacillus alkaliphilus TaxID=1548597 RepID=A0A4Q0VL29_9BACI|nr:GntR family transcriptional regulator [Anaerobacillus alkaliphilus]RXI96191.1 GntR family transcriptional regulator [Anaerobacillus alkaliphilus]
MDSRLMEDKPIFIQIAEQLEASILDGSIIEGERVPSTNEFAKHYQINPATAAKGINQLVDEDILFKKRGVGMFVAEGAKDKILAKRKNAFYQDFVVPLKKEAKKLGINLEELQAYIQRGIYDED